MGSRAGDTEPGQMGSGVPRQVPSPKHRSHPCSFNSKPSRPIRHPLETSGKPRATPCTTTNGLPQDTSTMQVAGHRVAPQRHRPSAGQLPPSRPLLRQTVRFRRRFSGASGRHRRGARHLRARWRESSGPPTSDDRRWARETARHADAPPSSDASTPTHALERNQMQTPQSDIERMSMTVVNDCGRTFVEDHYACEFVPIRLCSPAAHKPPMCRSHAHFKSVFASRACDRVRPKRARCWPRLAIAGQCCPNSANVCPRCLLPGFSSGASPPGVLSDVGVSVFP